MQLRMYTKEDYIRDLYIRDHSTNSHEKLDAKFRIELYERGDYAHLQAFINSENAPHVESNSEGDALTNVFIVLFMIAFYGFIIWLIYNLFKVIFG